MSIRRCYRALRFCERALPAADLDFAPDRPSRNVADAFLAAAADVCFRGALRCDSALPAALFDFRDVAPLLRVLDAFDAAFLPVCFDIRHLYVEDTNSGATTVPENNPKCYGVF